MINPTRPESSNTIFVTTNANSISEFVNTQDNLTDEAIKPSDASAHMQLDTKSDGQQEIIAPYTPRRWRYTYNGLL